MEGVIDIVLAWVTFRKRVANCDFVMAMMMESVCTKWHTSMKEEWTCRNGVWTRLFHHCKSQHCTRDEKEVQNFKEVVRAEKRRRPRYVSLQRYVGFKNKNAPKIMLYKKSSSVYTTIGGIARAMREAQQKLGCTLSFAWKSGGGIDFGDGNVILFDVSNNYIGPTHGECPEEVLCDDRMCDTKTKMTKPDRWSPEKISVFHTRVQWCTRKFKENELRVVLDSINDECFDSKGVVIIPKGCQDGNVHLNNRS